MAALDFADVAARRRVALPDGRVGLLWALGPVARDGSRVAKVEVANRADNCQLVSLPMADLRVAS